MSDDNTQKPLLEKNELPPEKQKENQLSINAESSLLAASGVFETHMGEEGFSINTVKAFMSDMRLLMSYIGAGQPVGAIGTNNLNDFLLWLLTERGVPCSPKTYARRVTTIKVFFGWLYDKGVIVTNPAFNVIQKSVKTPLPTPPSDAEIEAALAHTQGLRNGDTGQKPDARPHLLMTLLLETAVKKGEAMAIVPNHINEEDGELMLNVRYKNPSMRYKERKIELYPEFQTLLDEYLLQYEPTDSLFTCTARNLEYVLRDIGDAAGIAPGRLSFENLRWAAALSDYLNNMDENSLREKLGLSKVTWRETKRKLDQLKEKRAQLS